jgi:hypothetical protein
MSSISSVFMNSKLSEDYNLLFKLQLLIKSLEEKGTQATSS